MKKTLIVNIFGSPGAGKSTTATGAFSLLKVAGYNAEYVPEIAKNLVWEENLRVLEIQPYVFGSQLRSIERCLGKVDVLLTDSPLLLSAFYTDKYAKAKYPRSFANYVVDQFLSFPWQMNFYLDRTKAYNPAGRLQTEAESATIHDELLTLLDRHQIPYYRLDGNENAPSIVANRVKGCLNG